MLCACVMHKPCWDSRYSLTKLSEGPDLLDAQSLPNPHWQEQAPQNGAEVLLSFPTLPEEVVLVFLVSSILMVIFFISVTTIQFPLLSEIQTYLSSFHILNAGHRLLCVWGIEGEQQLLDTMPKVLGAGI